MGLTDMEKQILCRLLCDGADLPSNIADEIGRSRSAVSSRLSKLEESGYVKTKGRGVWQLSVAGTRAAQSLDCEFCE